MICNWKLSGTKFYRASSCKYRQFGTNMQNPCESLMRTVRADEGKILAGADQAGAEAKIVAYEAPKGRFRALFDNGIKPHTYMALQLFLDSLRGSYPAERYLSVEPPVLKAYPEWPALGKYIPKFKYVAYPGDGYFVGKKTIHAKNYDMKWRTFQTSTLEETQGKLRLSVEESKRFLNIHEMLFPEIILRQEELKTNTLKTRTVYNAFGFPIYFSELFSNDVWRQVFAAGPQSTVGVITHLAWTELQDRIEKEHLPWDLLNNKHDSILIQVPDQAEHKEMALAYLIEHLGRELTINGESFIMGVECKLGYIWADYDDALNPLGMKEVK
jgi:hypothetical protein